MEEWRDIKNYEGRYQVSNFGRVKSLERSKCILQGALKMKHTQMLKPTRLNNGYSQVALYKNNHCVKKSVHRLVAQAFIPNLENKPQVNHIDGDKSNNKAENLEWATSSENNRHSSRILERGAGHRLQQLTKNGEFICEYLNSVEASEKTGVSCSNILHCVCGDQKTAGGFVWRKKDEN